jgi:hypothetical protein
MLNKQDLSLPYFTNFVCHIFIVQLIMYWYEGSCLLTVLFDDA